MTPLLHAFVCKVMRDSATPCRMLVLGDERQTIFQFMDADARYLTRCADVFAGVASALPWRTLTLSTTYRLTGCMVEFFNRCVLRRPHVRTPRPPGQKVRLYTGNTFDIVETLGPQLLAALRTGALTPSDIFILAPSMRTGSAANKQPFNILANILTTSGVPVYVPLSDEEKLDEDLMRNKARHAPSHASSQASAVHGADARLPCAGCALEFPPVQGAGAQAGCGVQLRSFVLPLFCERDAAGEPQRVPERDVRRCEPTRRQAAAATRAC